MHTYKYPYSHIQLTNAHTHIHLLLNYLYSSIAITMNTFNITIRILLSLVNGNAVHKTMVFGHKAQTKLLSTASHTYDKHVLK